MILRLSKGLSVTLLQYKEFRSVGMLRAKDLISKENRHHTLFHEYSRNVVDCCGACAKRHGTGQLCNR
jgi:hypothetical protein